MQWKELLQEINAIHLTTFELGERYATGEQGAFVVVDQEKRRAVLKWTSGSQAIHRLEQARAVTDRLGEDGYPVPRYLYIGEALGGTYSVQLALSGSPLPLNRTAAYVPRLLQLNAMQVDQALPGLPDWHAVQYQPDGKHLRAITEAHHFETRYRTPQLDLWAPGEVEWHLIKRLPDYAPRRRKQAERDHTALTFLLIFFRLPLAL